MIHHRRPHHTTWLIGLTAGVLAVLGLLLILSAPHPSAAQTARTQELTDPGYVVLAWNDLGMHCYNANFETLSILPPANTIWAQVIRLGNPPEIVTTGVTVTYAIQDNTYSVGKSNFWEFADELGYNVAPNIGIAGYGLSGVMHHNGTHFAAEFVPLTEFTDSAYAANPANPVPEPYQLGIVQVWDATTGELLAETHPAVPVSTEMNCDDCHYDGGVEDIATGSVELNILTLHDREEANEYPPGTKYGDSLVANTPVQCADCHGSNALGIPSIGNLRDVSLVMHGQHSGEVPDTLEGCYQCHPGPETECLRGVMAWKHDLDCIDCHGTMADLAAKAEPWLEEPRCDDPGCHDSGAYDQNNPLYRLSSGHGDIYCEGCHDSPHAIAPSRVITDGIKFVGWQGHDGPIDSCVVCHATVPTAPGPHGLLAQDVTAFTFEPASLMTFAGPGEQVLHTHRLRNTGNLSDTYVLTWASVQGWADVTLLRGGLPVTSPVALAAGETLTVTATISVPTGSGVGSLVETTTITATSTVSPALTHSVVNVTRVARSRIWLPLVLRGS